jgi:CBS domain-containing protein
MKTAKQLLMNKPSGVVSIAPNATVLDALKKMAEKDIGALVVLDGTHLVGILSERDYARKVALMGKAAADVPVKDIMTHQVLCVAPHHSVDECMALMTKKRCRHLPVIEGKQVVGMLSIGDLVKEMLSEQQMMIQQLESYIHS